jgi:hypothetical protein
MFIVEVFAMTNTSMLTIITNDTVIFADNKQIKEEP